MKKVKNKITENMIGEGSIELLEKVGYHYIYAPNSDTLERKSFCFYGLFWDILAIKKKTINKKQTYDPLAFH